MGVSDEAMGVSDDLASLYQEQYAGGVESEWRRLGAVDKASNVVRAWEMSGGRLNPSVVEIGCGDGSVAERLSSLDFYEEYRGFDISGSGIAQARARQIPRAEFIVTKGARIDCEDNTADLAILTHVIEHLENPRGLLSEARRIAPIVIVEVPLELNGRMPRDYDWDPVGHINKYNAKSIRHLLQTCQLEIIAQFTTNHSVEDATFRRDSIASQARWRTRELLLRFAPQPARALFTYHETLVARRVARGHAY